MKKIFLVIALAANTAFSQWVYVWDARFNSPPPENERGVEVSNMDRMWNPDFYDYNAKYNLRDTVTPYLLNTSDGVKVPIVAEVSAQKARKMDTLSPINAAKASYEMQKLQEFVAALDKHKKKLIAFKFVYEDHFGEGALTNQAITEAYVREYFITRRVTRTSAPEDGMDLIALMEGFEVLKGFTGNETIWGFDWSLIEDD